MKKSVVRRLLIEQRRDIYQEISEFTKDFPPYERHRLNLYMLEQKIRSLKSPSLEHLRHER